MDLRSKLARLKPPVSPASVKRPTEEAISSDDRISGLRARLAELIDRSRTKMSREREEREALVAERLREAPLPFDEHDTAFGPLHVRLLRHGGSHLVGRVPVSIGLQADPQALALLALDPTFAAVPPSGVLYLDTEATGLAGGTGTIPFLVGLAWWEGGELFAEQLLLRRLGEEAPILARVGERLAKASMLVSFNGKAFDMPLLRTRFVMNRLELPKEPPHLDLVHLARRVHRAVRGRGGEGDPSSGPVIERYTDEGEARRATSCKLVALERQLLGFARVDDIPGAEVPAMYGHFLRTGDAEAMRAVCDHNLWDVVSMPALMGVYADAVRALEGEGELPSLGGRDLVGLARTLERAGDLQRARRAADAAVSVEEGDDDLRRAARKARGGIAKRSRDTDTALLDFGVLAEAHEDPSARLELAKLYEHRLRDPDRALAEVEAGTSEPEEAASRRRARLKKKTERAQQLPLPKARRR
ncbi:MAG: ribonuclease H-like domain-containing protein [Polyangiales bacterium]